MDRGVVLRGFLGHPFKREHQKRDVRDARRESPARYGELSAHFREPGLSGDGCYRRGHIDRDQPVRRHYRAVLHLIPPSCCADSRERLRDLERDLCQTDFERRVACGGGASRLAIAVPHDHRFREHDQHHGLKYACLRDEHLELLYGAGRVDRGGDGDYRWSNGRCWRNEGRL
ncbi:hypothetical protein D3C81_1438310 [compost metagenome]